MIFGRKKKARSAEDEAEADRRSSTRRRTTDAVPARRDDRRARTRRRPSATPTRRSTTDGGDRRPGHRRARRDRVAHGRPVRGLRAGGADDEPEDDQPRIDLGSIIVTPVPGSELRLQVNEAQDIVSAMLVLPVTAPVTNGAQPEVVGSSALELSAYAAPRSGGLWAELRDEISEAATEAGGSAELAAGPFGVELRRLLPVTTPEGEQGYQPSRMWVAEGPRWLLRGIVYGQAAIESDDDAPGGGGRARGASATSSSAAATRPWRPATCCR